MSRTYSKEEQSCKTRGKKELIGKLYEEGKTFYEIANIINTSYAAISRAFKRWGLKARTDGRFKNLPNKLGTNRLYVAKYLPKNEWSNHRVWVAKDGKGWTYLHRYLMEKHLGRKLERGEVIHHVDKNPLNNEISNLALCPSWGKHNSLYHRL